MQEKKTLRTKSSEFTKESDTNQAEHGYHFEEEDLEVVVEEIHDHSRELMGRLPNFMAIINQADYVLGKYGERLKVMDENSQIYLERLPSNQTNLIDLVYIQHLDSYLLDCCGKIYRKDIDEKPPYFFMNLHCGGRYHNTLRYSKLNKRLIVPKDGRKIAVVNLERKQIEIEILMKSGPGNLPIQDFIIFGRKENKISWITRSGLVNLSSISYDLKKITSKSSHQLELIQGRGEWPQTLAVCDQGKHLVAGLQDDDYHCSRMMTFKVKNLSLHLLHILDEYNQGLKFKLCFSFIQRFGKHLVWVAASYSDVSTYCFDCESGEMRELVGKRIAYRYVGIWKFRRIDEKCLYFVDFYGKLVRLTVRI